MSGKSWQHFSFFTQRFNCTTLVCRNINGRHSLSPNSLISLIWTRYPSKIITLTNPLSVSIPLFWNLHFIASISSGLTRTFEYKVRLFSFSFFFFFVLLIRGFRGNFSWQASALKVTQISICSASMPCLLVFWLTFSVGLEIESAALKISPFYLGIGAVRLIFIFADMLAAFSFKNSLHIYREI